MTMHSSQATAVTDKFDRRPFANQLANFIRNMTNDQSLTLGIYGPWGDGKTTMLDYMVEELSADSAKPVIVVRFNPWLYSTEAELLDQYFRCMRSAFREHFKKHGSQAEKLLKEYQSYIMASDSWKNIRIRIRREIKPIFLWLKKYCPFLSIFKSGVGAGIWNTINEYASEQHEDRKDNVNQELLFERQRIVIVIDDIDRLENHCIHSLFKLIRLIADFPYTCYVLAFDEEMVARALNDRYSDKTEQAGKKFIDKIVQVPLHMPKAADYQLADYLFELLEQSMEGLQIKLKDTEQTRFAQTLIEVLLVRLTTPRSCERYVNALTFLMPLMHGEVNMVDAMVLEGARILFPEVYQLIRTSSELIHPPVHSPVAWDEPFHMLCLKDGFESATESYTINEKASARRLFLELLPMFIDDRTKKDGWFRKTDGVDSSNWLTEKRLASDFYFHRYFAYTVSSKELSDIAIDSILRDTATYSVQGLIESIDLITPDDARAGNFIIKLSARGSEIPQNERKKFALAIAMSGNKYLRAGILRRSRFYQDHAWEQAIRFIIFMLENGHPADRDTLVPELIEHCQPLLFLLRIFWRLPKVGDPQSTNEAFHGFSKNEINAFGTKIVEMRIRPNFTNLLNSTDLIELRASINVWGAYEPETLTSLLTAMFQNPAYLLKVLSCYLGEESHFVRDTYNELTKAIDAKLIYESILAVRHNPAFISCTELGTIYGTAVEQFMRIYEHVRLHESPEN